MRTAAVVCITLIAFSSILTTLLAVPTIGIHTDAQTYQSGDTIEVSLSGQNDDEVMSVAVYVGIILPDGDIWSTQYHGWRHCIEPWIPSIDVPAWFEMNRTRFWRLDLPCTTPPIGQEGQYCFASVLTYPGTFNWVSTLALAPFMVNAPPGSHYYVNAETGNDANDGSETWPWKTITHGLASAKGSAGNPATIHVAAGTYAASTNGEAFPLIMKSWVSLAGKSSEGAVLDPQNCARAILADAVEGCSAEYLTITNGYTAGQSGEDGAGGGVYCAHCEIRISNCVLTENEATFGGAIYCLECSPSILYNLLSKNQAGYGGAIRCDSSSPIIEGNVISENMSTGGWGGGIGCVLSSPDIRYNRIIRNHSPLFGGGIHCYGGSSPVIFANEIVSNSADYLGGGIYISGGSQPGAQSAPVILCNLLAENYAGAPKKYGGGAIFCGSFSAATITDNTIADNSAVLTGGICCEPEDTRPTITDNIIWANGDDLDGCSATYCCVEDGDEGEGNIHDDPMFVSGPLGEYYLHPDSACIDAGSRSAADAGLSDRTTQADGTPDTGTVDMGYHYPLP